MLIYRLGVTIRVSRLGLLCLGISMCAGCRSGGSFSQVPGMGWLANRNVAANPSSTADPAASLPPPSSAESANSLANVPSNSPPPVPGGPTSTQTAGFNAPIGSTSTVAPNAYPSTGYPQVATRGNVVASNTTIATGGTSSGTASDSAVQQGDYSIPPSEVPASVANAAGPPPVTTWDFPPQQQTPGANIAASDPSASAPDSAADQYQFASAPAPPNATAPPADNGISNGVYEEFPQPGGANSPATHEAVYPVSQGSPEYPPQPQGGVAPASYAAEDPSYYDRPVCNGSSCTMPQPSAQQPWRPGSTAGYSGSP